MEQPPDETCNYGDSQVKTLARSAFITDRRLDFFSEAELTRQCGYSRPLWPQVAIKELIDNGLDGCEATNVPPEITIQLDADAITVSDNGPGLRPEIVERSLDFAVRVSDKRFYSSPTRGQIGNGIKVILAAACVSTGEGHVRISACGREHEIRLGIDGVVGQPRIAHSQKASSVKNGT